MENNDKLNEYKQRHKEWRDISVTQLSNANNILITLSTGLLALGLKSGKENEFSCSEKISFILLAISICYGIAVLFSRLYDFRISRHLALTRQRFYNEYIKEKGEENKGEGSKGDESEKYKKGLLPDNHLGNVTYCNRIMTFLPTLLCSIGFINKDEITTNSYKDTKNKFQALRKKSDILGSATWIWTKYQVFFFLSGAILYFITQLFNF